MQTKPTDPHHRRGLGLDKPCSQCGQPIYYGYKGPIEGICGRCADKVVARKTRVLTRTVHVRKRTASFWFWMLVSFAAGAGAAILAYPYLGI